MISHCFNLNFLRSNIFHGFIDHPAFSSVNCLFLYLFFFWLSFVLFTFELEKLV